MENNVKIGSVRQIYNRLSAEGYMISEYRLRQWIKADRLPAIMLGKKALIRYSDVLHLLDGPQTAA